MPDAPYNVGGWRRTNRTRIRTGWFGFAVFEEEREYADGRKLWARAKMSKVWAPEAPPKMSRVEDVIARVRRDRNASTIQDAIDRGLTGIDDPMERILYAFACRYAGNVALGDNEAAADAMEKALAALRSTLETSSVS